MLQRAILLLAAMVAFQIQAAENELTPAEKKAIIAFMKTLTDSTFITDERFSDPFIKVDKRKRNPDR